MDPLAQALFDECCRLSEDCKYTALTFTIWLRSLRRRRTLSLILPVIFGSLATAGIVTQHLPAWAAVFSLLATVIPLVYRASKTDKEINQFKRLAGEFTNLRDRFRQLSKTGQTGEVSLFESEFKLLMVRMDKARSFVETPPERCYIAAKKKIQRGDMRHDYDEQASTK